MKNTTLVLLFNDKNQILLCMKKRGFGIGKWNGAGGKLEQGETVIEAAIRELLEETGINLEQKDLQPRGILHFYFEDNNNWNQDVYLFTGKYNGEFKETEEMKPQWFDLDKIPYNEMWLDDIHWLPRIVNQISEVEYEFIFTNQGELKDYKLIK